MWGFDISGEVLLLDIKYMCDERPSELNTGPLCILKARWTRQEHLGVKGLGGSSGRKIGGKWKRAGEGWGGMVGVNEGVNECLE